MSSTSNEVNDFDPFRSNFDNTLSQVTHIGTQMSSDDDNDDIILQFVNYNRKRQNRLILLFILKSAKKEVISFSYYHNLAISIFSEMYII